MPEELQFTKDPSTSSHRVTFYLDQGFGLASYVTTDTNEPEEVQKRVASAIHNYYRFRWWIRPKTVLIIGGTPLITIPIAKVLCVKIERIRR